MLKKFAELTRKAVTLQSGMLSKSIISQTLGIGGTDEVLIFQLTFISRQP